ncbi:MAG: 7TM-DISM domain-containing protein [Pseudomonadales bacterium]|nr:7TM-DISM domain-containing protein [Pseudomonadales bacterium]
MMSKESTFTFGFTDATMWFRFELHNQTDTVKELILQMSNAQFDSIGIYLQQNNKVQSFKSGKDHPFDSRVIALAEKHKPHLILMDYGLPDMTGIEAYKQIQGVPVIFLSGYGLEKVSQEINAYWTASVMQKLFLIEDLQRAVLEELTTDPKTLNLLQARK